MGIGTFLRSLFSRQAQSPTAEALPGECYQGFEIVPDPMPEGDQYRVQGWISVGERQHRFIRADLLPTREACAVETLRKARLLIDQQGMALFD